MFPANENIAILFESFELRHLRIRSWQDELIEQPCVSLHCACSFWKRTKRHRAKRAESARRKAWKIQIQDRPESLAASVRVKVLGGHTLQLARSMSASETGPLYTRARLIARVNRTLCAGSLYRANTFGRYEWPVASSVRSTRINLPEKEKVKKAEKNRKRTGTESKNVVAIGRFIVCALPGCNSS